MIYIEGCDSLPKLSHKEHQELFARYKSGDLQARNRLVESVLKVAINVINKSRVLKRYREDVLSEAFLKLVTSLDGWDGERPLMKYVNAILWNVTTTKWSNLNVIYMNPSTAKEVKRAAKYETAEEIVKNCKCSLKRARQIIGARAAMTPIYYQSDKKHHEFEQEEASGDFEPCLADLEEYAEKLPQLEREIFKLRFGLNCPKASATEAAKVFGITLQECSWITRVAKDKIRQMVFRDYGESRVMSDGKKCQQCGVFYRPNSSTQKFCGSKCQQKNYNESKRVKHGSK